MIKIQYFHRIFSRYCEFSWINYTNFARWKTNSNGNFRNEPLEISFCLDEQNYFNQAKPRVIRDVQKTLILWNLCFDDEKSKQLWMITVVLCTKQCMDIALEDCGADQMHNFNEKNVLNCAIEIYIHILWNFLAISQNQTKFFFQCLLIQRSFFSCWENRDNETFFDCNENHYKIN